MYNMAARGGQSRFRLHLEADVLSSPKRVVTTSCGNAQLDVWLRMESENVILI